MLQPPFQIDRILYVPLFTKRRAKRYCVKPNPHFSNALPVGQQAREDFPRFGITRFAPYRGMVSEDYSVLIAGDVEAFSITQADLSTLERVEQVSDFHCVTTWSYRGVRWSCLLYTSPSPRD